MTRLEDYPRVAIVQTLNHDDEIAWLRTFALVSNRYAQSLENDGEFGVDFEILIAKKGLTATLNVGDAFRTFNPNDDENVEIIGSYVPGVDTL